MIKVIPPGSWDFDKPNITMAKMTDRGLRGNDLNDFIKQAGCDMAYELRQLDVKPGDIPIHLIALGATESTGPNRNHDAFSAEACRKYADTFVKHARWYRNHQNKDKSKSYGVIKVAKFNEAMQRVELLVFLNGTKEASKRNGGLIADKEMEKLASGDPPAVSMACHVAYDVCSSCGNKAKSRSEYCEDVEDGGHCKRGGLKSNIGRVCEDGHVLHADNPHPRFFDLSMVFRPADRIAYVLGRLDKQAAAGKNTGGAQLAEEMGLTAPIETLMYDTPNSIVYSQLKLAEQLAEFERQIAPAASNMKIACAMPVCCQLKYLPETYEKIAALTALAREKIILDLTNFIHVATNRPYEKAASLSNKIKPFLPNIYNKMLADPERLLDEIKMNPFKPQRIEPPQYLQKMALQAAPDFALSEKYLQKRVWKAVIHEVPVNFVKTAETEPDEAHDGVARAYALYKLAFLNELKTDSEFNLVADMAVRQNYLA